MTKELKSLFKDLDFFWNIGSSPNLKGEHPNCQIVQNKIRDVIIKMEFDDIALLFNELSDEQMDQIISIIEDIIEEIPETEEIFKEIEVKRDIPWLTDELKLLGII